MLPVGCNFENLAIYKIYCYLPIEIDFDPTLSGLQSKESRGSFAFHLRFGKGNEATTTGGGVNVPP